MLVTPINPASLSVLTVASLSAHSLFLAWGPMTLNPTHRAVHRVNFSRLCFTLLGNKLIVFSSESFLQATFLDPAQKFLAETPPEIFDDDEMRDTLKPN